MTTVHAGKVEGEVAHSDLTGENVKGSRRFRKIAVSLRN